MPTYLSYFNQQRVGKVAQGCGWLQEVRRFGG